MELTIGFSCSDHHQGTVGSSTVEIQTDYHWWRAQGERNDDVTLPSSPLSHTTRHCSLHSHSSPLRPLTSVLCWTHLPPPPLNHPLLCLYVPPLALYSHRSHMHCYSDITYISHVTLNYSHNLLIVKLISATRDSHSVPCRWYTTLVALQLTDRLAKSVFDKMLSCTDRAVKNGQWNKYFSVIWYRINDCQFFR